MPMRFLILVLALSGITLPGAEARLEVVAMNSVIADIARQVGGNDVLVTSLIPPGQDLHGFSPSPGDMRQVRQSRIVLTSGLGLEAGFLSKLQSQDPHGPLFVSLGDSMTPLASSPTPHEHEHEHDDEHGEIDPHWWHSIPNARMASKVICDAFIQADPDHAEAYTIRTAAFDKKLSELARWVRVTMARLPRDRRILVTSHDAFGYFAHDYGFTVRPVAGLSSEDKPSSKNVRALIAAIQANHVPAIFIENTENPKVLTEITRETGTRIGGMLYSGGLGEKEATSYEDMVRHNVETIVNGLTPNSNGAN
jgi:zinc/manganese transport system substrate-binding protein